MTGAGLAVVVALLATTAYHLGLIVEKRALAELPAIDARHAVRLLKVLLTAPSWLAGFVLMLCGFALQVIALTLAPVSIVQPVLGSGLVLAVAASPFPYVTVGCSALGMLIFQTGLQRSRVSIVGPVSNITGSVFFLVLGTWLFGERLPADPARLALRLGGIVLAAIVVIALSRRPSRAAPAGLMPSAEPADGTAAPMIGAA